MRAFGFARDLLRSDGAGAHRVTYTELFFDLVFVFAVTQVSHVLLHEQSALTLLHTVMLAMVVWWVWMFTTWASSWLDPERGAVRALFVVLMLLGLLLASAIPEAFGDRAVLFAVCLVLMQLGRAGFTLFAFGRSRPEHAVNFVRIIVWHAMAGALWLAGAFLPDQARLVVWLIALAVDYVGPRLRFCTPGLGRSPLSSWNISGAHLSERVSLFLIIALGESIVVTGAAFSTAPLDVVHLAAFLAAFAGTVLLWLLYFSHSQRGGSEYIERAAERGMIAQTAYTYIPLLLVLGIVLSAVADGLVLERPVGVPTPWTAGLLCGSAIVYLVGLLLFRRATGMRWSLTVVVGAVVLGVLWAVAGVLPTAVVAWTVNGVLALVVVAEQAVYRRRASS
ncbi:low temperature requirement protein A [Leifsonia shinshuensis]|uniref:Low temperature requirement protein A n=1 Tax=Leifsonia shinshuensis TaxID=150026 RepID=A0A7G6Y669_9MICO|nr:low temperature requirement protein A [Leifsonia shinshuensis]QNE33984.1 low temperature requirement protein A [Leifsonia shinshuensis]